MLRLSTIIPFKNIREYIEESLDSVISQDLEDREIILVDDASTDGSGDYARALAEKYDWIRCISTDSRGPGGARNAGIAVAQGKYLNFADADDIVPAGTYRTMYETAEATGADIVIGKAVRLIDETGELKASRLHDRVYSRYYYETNIRDNPYLIYDTTVWNKMVRRDFWQGNNVIFPEKTPYQDIPATFRLHYNAKKVIMLDEVVYLWRVRQGNNLSITQQRFDPDNFRARLNMIKLVDRFISENVSEKDLIKAKKIKWLDTDLKAFMNESVVMDDDSSYLMMQMMREYIKETGLDKAIKHMPFLAAEEYKAVMENDLQRLRRIRHFEMEEFKGISSKWGLTAPVGEFPKEIAAKGKADLRTTIDLEHLTQKIIKIDAEDNGYAIFGYAFLMHQPLPKRQLAHMKAYLIRSTGECVCEIPLEQHISKRAANKGKDENGNVLCDYYGSGYTIHIDKKTLASLDKGKYHIRLVWKSLGQSRDTTLRGIGEALAGKLDEKTLNLDGRTAEITRTYKKEPELHIL